MFSTIYLDLDDVLVDFDRAMCQVMGMQYEEAMRIRDGRWCISEWGGVRREDLFKEIDKYGFSFWSELKSHHWMESLIDSTLDYADNVCIATCPGPFRYSRWGKRCWYVRQVWGRYPVDIRINSAKEEYAEEGTLLVDDKPENCRKFKDAGGEALLFPSYGNYLKEIRGMFLENPNLVKEWFEDAVQIFKR